LSAGHAWPLESGMTVKRIDMKKVLQTRKFGGLSEKSAQLNASQTYVFFVNLAFMTLAHY
jgi:hypothetical protein